MRVEATKVGSTMSKGCQICGKHPVAGRSISHSHRTVNRTFRPNIQSVHVVVDGRKQKMNVCTTCLKSGKVARS
jgi:large subunit ribosomal protein L28